MFNKSVSAVALCLMCTAGTASAKTYICKIDSAGNSGWIPEVVVIDHNEKTEQVTVNDPIIQYFKEQPIAGKAGISNAKRVSFSWSLDDITRQGGGSRQFVSDFAYRAVIQNSSHKISITAKPRGYRNTFRGKGTCSVKE